jgi:hypothetical protein
MNEDLMVLIVDANKLSKGEFTELFKKAGQYVARIRKESYKKVTDSVDQIQEEELIKSDKETE